MATRKSKQSTQSKVGVLPDRGDPVFRGFIERVENGCIGGWASDIKHPDKAIQISLLDAGMEIAQFVASDFRSDVRDTGFSEGACGFVIPLPNALLDEREHHLTLACGGIEIPGSDFLVVLSKSMAPQRILPIDGFIDGIQGGFVVGWAFDPQFSDYALNVQLIVNEQLVCSDIANRYRQDLKEQGKGGGYCLFCLPVPPYLLDGRPLRVEVVEQDSGISLPGIKIFPSIQAQDIELTLTQSAENRILIEVIGFSTGQIKATVWVDGIYADSVEFPQGELRSHRIDWSLPRRFQDSMRHLITINAGESHIEYARIQCDTSAEMVSPHEILPSLFLRKGSALPPVIQTFLKNAFNSCLFDFSYFSLQAGQTFSTPTDALLTYLREPRLWKLATSPWLDVPYIREVAGNLVRSIQSPLEWYLSQPLSSEFGPNPLFSNSDFQLLSGAAENSYPKSASWFDDWVNLAGRSAELGPSLLIDLKHFARQRNIPEENPRLILDGLLSWLSKPEERRNLGVLHPLFDQAWIEQEVIRRQISVGRCLLTSFKTAKFTGLAPHPILQDAEPGKNYFALLNQYEKRWISSGIDDVSTVSTVIKPDVFYSIYPSSDNRREQSSLSQYAATGRFQSLASFIVDLDIGFVSAEFPGLLDYAKERRGISDLNYLWKRWLRDLGMPGSLRMRAGLAGECLSLERLNYLRRCGAPKTKVLRASLIIPTYGRDDLVLQCILSLFDSNVATDVEIIIAEDAPQTDCGWLLNYFLPFTKHIANPVNLGFLLNCKEAVKHAISPLFLLVNNDVIVHRNSLNELIDTFDRRPDAAVVGGLILNADGTIQENGGMLWSDGSAWNFQRNAKIADESLFNIRETDYVTGCWIAIRKTIWDELGGFDERYVPAYYEEADFCMSCWQRGYKVFVNPLSVVTHLDGATMGQDENGTGLKVYQRINKEKFYNKWQYALATSHNPNGQPTSFHTGRVSSGRFITVVMDHYIPEPDRDAGSRSTFALCEAMAALKDNLVLFIPANNSRTSYALGLERLGIEVITGVSGWKRFDELMANHPGLIRHVVISRIEVAQKFSWHVDQLRCPKTIYIMDIDVLRSFSYNPESPGFDAMVSEVMTSYIARNLPLFNKFEYLLSLSSDETKLLKPFLGDKVIDVFPYNMINLEVHNHPDDRTDILFIGSYNHPPNREAVQFLLQEVWPRVETELPNARLHLCGSGMQNAKFAISSRIVFHGTVTDQTLSFLYGICRVAVAPLISGAGLKGKVIEASAHGVPCVGTKVAWQGLEPPVGYENLSGSAETFGARLVTTYQAFRNKTVDDMLLFSNTCHSVNPMREVIAHLVQSGRTNHQS